MRHLEKVEAFFHFWWLVCYASRVPVHRIFKPKQLDLLLNHSVILSRVALMSGQSFKKHQEFSSWYPVIVNSTMAKSPRYCGFADTQKIKGPPLGFVSHTLSPQLRQDDVHQGAVRNMDRQDVEKTGLRWCEQAWLKRRKRGRQTEKVIDGHIAQRLLSNR